MQTKNLTLPPATELQYCLQKQPSYNGFPNFDCLYYDEDLVVYPDEEATGMFITTRLTQSVESTNGCDLRDNTCKYNVTSPEVDYYIACIENFTILIDHAMYAERLDLSANSQTLPGVLNDPNGNQMAIPPDNTVGKEGFPDVMNVSLMLRAAGINSLDARSGQNPKRSIREDGLVLLVFISYSNTYTFDTDDIRYEYNVKVQKNTKFKVVQTTLVNGTSSRVIWNRHGIRLLFIQSGQLGRYDFQTMLLNIVSGLGLLALATVVVDLIGLRLFPQTSQLYRQYKYEPTPDRGRVDYIEPLSDVEDERERTPIINYKTTETEKTSQG